MRVLVLMVIVLSGVARAMAGEPWVEFRFGTGSYGLASSEPPADGGDVYLGDEAGRSWEIRTGYAGVSPWSPGVAVTRYSAGRDGGWSSWAFSALAAHRSRKPTHWAGLGVDVLLGLVRTDIEWASGHLRGKGVNAAACLSIEPSVGVVSIPVFAGVRYAAVRNVHGEGPLAGRSGVLDYSGVFLGVGLRLGGAANTPMQRAAFSRR
jgi:hypothetical protein